MSPIVFEEIATLLGRVPLFSALQPADLRLVAECCEARQAARGELVFAQGQPCEGFFIVISGQVKLFAVSPAGQEKVIELIGDGDSFAEAMMFLRTPYAVNAQALTATRLVRIDRVPFLDAVGSNNRLALAMLGGLSRRLHGLIHDVKAYALDTGVQRVIGYLLRDVDDAAPVDASTERPLAVSLPVSKATIASRLSMTPEYFSRVLHGLEGEGLIEIDRRDVRIVDVERLRRYSREQFR